MNTRWMALAVFGVTICATTARAEDWTQWRGSRRDAISTEKGLLKAWPKDGPKLLWQVSTVDYGFGGVAAAGARVYVIGNKGVDDEFLRALSVKDGKQIWSARLGKVGNPKQQPSFPGAHSTPAVDGKFVYALGSDGDLVCVEAATGKEAWRKSLREDFGGKPGTWAYAESPLLDGNMVVVTPGGEQATVVAVNKATGDVLWKASIPGETQAAYSSTVSAVIGGTKQVVAYLDKSLVGLDAASGKLLWRFGITSDETRPTLHAFTPIAYKDSVYTTDAYVGILVGVKSAQGAMTAAQTNKAPKSPCALGGALRIGDNLYGTNYNQLLCVDFATGNLKWEDRSVGAASICCADGGLYLHSENGEVALVTATPTGYHEGGRFTPPNQPERGSAKAWAHPVVANGRLYIRDLGMLWCYDVKAGK